MSDALNVEGETEMNIMTSDFQCVLLILMMKWFQIIC